MLRQMRESRATRNEEGPDDSETSYESDDSHGPKDKPNNTQTANDTAYPNIREYIQNNIIDARVQVSNTMRDALLHYVYDVRGSDPVSQSLNGIHEALESVQSSKAHKDEKRTAGSKPRVLTQKRKAQKFAHYQRLFKKDKSKLASEIFDGVDNSALKPPMSEAYEHFRKIWTVDTQDAGTLECKASVGSDVLLCTYNS